MTMGPSPQRIQELKDAGFDVAPVTDLDPPLYRWLHLASGASQGDQHLRHKQPARRTSAQAWKDCDYYYSGCVPMVPEVDWEAPVTLVVGDSLVLKNGSTVTLCKGHGIHGRYFFSHNLEGLNVVYGAVDFDTADDVKAGSKHLLGVTVLVAAGPSV